MTKPSTWYINKGNFNTCLSNRLLINFEYFMSKNRIFYEILCFPWQILVDRILFYFENLNIFTNNIIFVKAVKVLW
jgi:hypothetical protein